MFSKPLDLVCHIYLHQSIYGQETDVQVSWFYHEVLFPTTARRRKWQKGPKSTSVSFPLDRRFAVYDIITTQKHVYTCRTSQHLAQVGGNHHGTTIAAKGYTFSYTVKMIPPLNCPSARSHGQDDIQSIDLILGLYPSRTW